MQPQRSCRSTVRWLILFSLDDFFISMKMDRWAANRQEVRRYLGAHPIFRFIVAFCFGFTGWCVAGLILGSTENSFRAGVLHGVIFAAFLTSLFFVIQRQRQKREPNSSDHSSPVI